MIERWSAASVSLSTADVASSRIIIGGFAKIANEAQALQDRMSALYEDMGGILNRYFEIKELKTKER